MATSAIQRADALYRAGNLAGLKKLVAASDARDKASIIGSLRSDPRSHPGLGDGVVALAVESADDPSADVRYSVASCFNQQDGWGADMTPAVTPLLKLLHDADASVRRMAVGALGNIGKRRRYDWSPHLERLRQMIRDPSFYIPENAASTLAKMCSAKHDIGAAVADLAFLLSDPQEYNEPRKAAARALLCHARKSAANREQVRRAVAAIRSEHKEVRRLREQLDGA